MQGITPRRRGVTALPTHPAGPLRPAWWSAAAPADGAQTLVCRVVIHYFYYYYYYYYSFINYCCLFLLFIIYIYICIYIYIYIYIHTCVLHTCFIQHLTASKLRIEARVGPDRRVWAGVWQHVWGHGGHAQRPHPQYFAPTHCMYVCM